MRQPLTDKVAIVTGAGQGIGQAVALRLAREGAHVVVAELNPQTAKKVAHKVRVLGRGALACPMDVADVTAIHAMVAQTVAEFGRIDVLVNNAGIMQTKPTDKHLAVALFLFLLSVYMLTYSGTLHSSDGQAMFSVAESFVRRLDYDINQIRWMGLQQGSFGPDGNLYCRKGLGTSLVAIPLAWLGLVVPFWGVVQTTMLLNVFVTALTGTVLFLYVRRLGYSQSTGGAIALIYGLGTMAWPYAKIKRIV